MSLKEKIRSAKEVLEGDKGLNKTYVSENSFPDEEAAIKAFKEAKKRMFDVNSWGEIPGPNATFVLYDKNGYAYQKEAVEEVKPQIYDYIKTLLPSGLPENWVRVVDVKEEPDRAFFTVRPSSDPTDKDQAPEVTEHFFKSKSTSTFKVERNGKSIVAFEAGVDETINNEDPEAGKRNTLNTAIAEGGWAFVQKIQWKNVTDYIVGIKELKKEKE